MDRRDLEGNLGPLREMGEYDVAPHEPDPRGWQVLSSDGTQIGNVDDLIVDTKDMKVHYLDCDLDESRLNLSGGDRDRHILVPVENASLNESDRKVRVHGMNADDVLALPAYMGGALTPGIASRVSQFFGSRGSTAREPTGRTTDRTTTDRTMKGTGRDENIGRDFDEQRLTRSEEEMAVGKRMVDAGEIRIHKTVETEHVTRPVTRHHEEVDVERQAVSGQGKPGRITDKDEDIRIPVREEELVVEKRPEVKEELVVRKRDVEEQVDVEADLRRERIDVERHGRAPGQEGELRDELKDELRKRER
jgi:uncharacterized protein (TIGR02271 family)